MMTSYVQGAGIDEPLAQSRSGLSFYNADGLGSITSLTDSSGAPTGTFVYGAFGVLNSSTGTTANSYRYIAREYDQETGLYYYRARYYDSTEGRFLSEDPIRFNGGIDFYRYANNNPARYIDPLGKSLLCPSWLPGCPDNYKHKQLVNNAQTDEWIRDQVAVIAQDPFCYGQLGAAQLVEIWRLERINTLIDAVELGKATLDTIKEIPGIEIPNSLDLDQVHEFLLTIRDQNNAEIDLLVGEAAEAQSCPRCRLRR